MGLSMSARAPTAITFEKHAVLVTVLFVIRFYLVGDIALQYHVALFTLGIMLSIIVDDMIPVITPRVQLVIYINNVYLIVRVVCIRMLAGVHMTAERAYAVRVIVMLFVIITAACAVYAHVALRAVISADICAVYPVIDVVALDILICAVWLKFVVRFPIVRTGAPQIIAVLTLAKFVVFMGLRDNSVLVFKPTVVHHAAAVAPVGR